VDVTLQAAEKIVDQCGAHSVIPTGRARSAVGSPGYWI
jgi:hypothetical protein